MYQIGDAAAIAAETGIPTVSDFRRLDIMLGGQGAPLVPVGDNLLFGQYDYCLNIGGFSNISWRDGDKRIAFDISPVNYVINRFTRSIGLEMDRDGEIARKGTVHQPLLDQLNALDYYSKTWPKSLGREWVEANVFPLLDASGLTMEDLLRTYYEHCAEQLAKVTSPGKSLLVTGGGAYNKFLIERMRALSGCNIVVPEPAIIEFKEALIFAFLGVLYMWDIPSCLRSVTGAAHDNIGGMLFKV
jgi:anhydro-N-acetylmuramic acid kinase